MKLIGQFVKISDLNVLQVSVTKMGMFNRINLRVFKVKLSYLPVCPGKEEPKQEDSCHRTRHGA